MRESIPELLMGAGLTLPAWRVKDWRFLKEPVMGSIPSLHIDGVTLLITDGIQCVCEVNGGYECYHLDNFKKTPKPKSFKLPSLSKNNNHVMLESIDLTSYINQYV